MTHIPLEKKGGRGKRTDMSVPSDLDCCETAYCWSHFCGYTEQLPKRQGQLSRMLRNLDGKNWLKDRRIPESW